MDAFGELLVDDADFVNVYGMRWRDTMTIRESRAKAIAPKLTVR